ncbi:ATP-binding protein [Acinetobacter sp. YH12057]|uniref:ATP-binding protein n=1 Tax=Acinetobacter sp. YH12057 TaxID=2601057 RepID=UPI0015D46683|nr:ATP-binding protein [Acinetobacter sp. YH12057]
MTIIKGKTQITNEGIKKHFNSKEPFKSIFEYIWNGFDAKANNVNISLIRNEAIGLDYITILDDGDGIDISNLCNSFDKFNESSKKNDDNVHGSHGRGRLAFHTLANNAVWYTKFKDTNAKISISADNISEYDCQFFEDNDQNSNLKKLKSGTFVVLSSLYSEKTKNFPTDESFVESLRKEFSWLLIVNPQKKLLLNGVEIPILDNSNFERDVQIQGFDFKIKAIRWHEKPSNDKSYNYLLNSQQKTISKVLSKANNKIDFHTSCFALSEWNDSFNKDLLEIDSSFELQQKILRDINSEMSNFLKEIYEDYLREYVDEQIEKYDEKGYFPSYIGYENSYALWRKRNTKDAVKSIYLADPKVFANLSIKPLKIIIRMLDKLLVSNENDAIFDVLDNVLDLNDTQVDLLAKQLKSTTLENIISTIETLQKREIAINKLKELMNNHYKTVLETPDLQKIIEANTWLFGSQYEILGAEEDSFTTISHNLRNTITGINDFGTEDLDKEDENNEVVLEGLNRQVDLFLARKRKTVNSTNQQIYKCVVIEIKRPSVSLNHKHLQQLLEYASIISNHPELGNSKLYFELILVGRKISKNDYLINSHLKNNKDKNELGLVLDDGKIKCYVKDWYTIFEEFNLSNSYLLDNLKSKYADLSDESKISLVDDLQGKIAS